MNNLHRVDVAGRSCRSPSIRAGPGRRGAVIEEMTYAAPDLHAGGSTVAPRVRTGGDVRGVRGRPPGVGIPRGRGAPRRGGGPPGRGVLGAMIGRPRGGRDVQPSWPRPSPRSGRPVRHTRRTPLRHAFSYRHYHWLVDLDDLPRLRGPLAWLARFDPADHLVGGRLGGGTRGDLALPRAARRRAARTTGCSCSRTPACSATPSTRSAFWSYSRSAPCRRVLEVHNTYGDRHAYLVTPRRWAALPWRKDLYVSPLNDGGHYEVRPAGPRAGHRRVRPQRRRPPLIDADLAGTARPGDAPAVLARLAQGLVPLRVSPRIRVQGLRLWARRLPVLPSPPAPEGGCPVTAKTQSHPRPHARPRAPAAAV